jgi:hypothetical protein
VLVPVDPPKPQMMPVPVQDFNLEVLKTIPNLPPDILDQIESVEVYESVAQKTATSSSMSEGIIQYDQLKMTLEWKRVIIRTLNAKDALTTNSDGILFDTMKSMDPKADHGTMQRLANGMLSKMLRSTDPRLHNVCLSDMSRGTVRIFSRAPNSDKGYWAVYPKVAAVEALNQHTRNIFSFLLEAGIQSVTPAIFKFDKRSCLALKRKEDEDPQTDWSITLFENKGKLCVKNTETHRLLYSPNVPVDPKLMELVQMRKDEVLENLRRLLLEQKDVETCLKETRPVCYSTMKETLAK